MFKYILKRLLATVITLWAVITITFAMMHALPGNPFLSEKALSQQYFTIWKQSMDWTNL